MLPSSTFETQTSTPRQQTDTFHLLTTKPELAEVLSQEKSDIMSVNKQGGLVIKGESKHIVSSTVQQDGETLIDSAMELDPTMTTTIYTTLQKEIPGLTTNDTATKEYQTLDHLQQILQQELGTITNISAAESEQSHAIANSNTGIITSKNLSQKMCTLRAGYTAHVLSKLGRETTTLCGLMDGQGHARNILKSQSGRTMMFDPMNPKMDQNYPFINSNTLSSDQYNKLRNGSYLGPIIMNNHTYELGLS